MVPALPNLTSSHIPGTLAGLQTIVEDTFMSLTVLDSFCDGRYTETDLIRHQKDRGKFE